ncbi:MAG: efflux RND transporter permease subunit, partial [Myxococcota bacterium]
MTEYASKDTRPLEDAHTPQPDAIDEDATRASAEAQVRGPLAWMATNRVAANILMSVLLFGGCIVLATSIKQEVFPEVDLDTVSVQIDYPGASPAEVEQGVVLAVEEAVRGLDGVEEVQSTAREGSASVTVRLLIGADPDAALNDVKSAVDRISSFPEDAERPVISLLTNRNQVLSVVISAVDQPGESTEEVLKQLAEQLREELLSDDGISYAEVSGARPLEISVEVAQDALRKYGLTLPAIADAISQSSVEIPGGSVKTDSGEILLRTAERRDQGQEFGDIVLLAREDGTTVRLRDVAQVHDGFQELDQETYFNGRRAIMVQVYRVGRETPIEVSSAVQRHLELRQWPPGVNATLWNDQSVMYRERVELLGRNAALGLMLVLVILGMFLEPKLAFWVTLGIPISFAGALLFLPIAEVSINMISLFAFIVTLGMVVDDAIVVGESIYKQREAGKSFAEASIQGVREVAVPVTFSIITTCVAFSPMLFIPGFMGKFFRVIPAVVIGVLIVSLIESFFVLPAHLSHRMPWWLQGLFFPLFKLMELLGEKRVSKGLSNFIETRYRPFVRAALRWRYVTVATCIAVFLASMGIVSGGRLPFTFLPKIEGDIVQVNLEMPVSTPASETSRLRQELVDAGHRALLRLGGEDDLRGLMSSLGSRLRVEEDRLNPGSSGGHVAAAMLALVPTSEREFTTGELAQLWRDEVQELPGARSLTFEYAIGADSGAAIDVELSHPDAETLEGAAAELAQKLQSYAGVADIDAGFSQGKQQLDIRLRPEARALGLSESDIARQVRGAYYGSEAVRQQRGRDEVRVYVRLPLEERQSLYSVEQLIVRTPSNGEIPLAQAATIDFGRAYTEINRTEGKRTVSVTADVDESEGNANQVVASLVEKELPQLMTDYPGLTYRFGGQQEAQSDALTILGLGFLMALIIMYGLLAIVFRSYAQPTIVLSAIPFGFVGAIWGHVLMNSGLSVMSMMGVVALSGVVVNDSLILIVAVNEYRRTHSTEDAVVEGSVRRFRPILLTSLTTFFGLVPMILETSVQARFLIPMAISLGFGVLFATFIILIQIPAS